MAPGWHLKRGLLNNIVARSETEPHAGVRLPWALLGAIALIALVDVAVRVTHAPRVVPYDLGIIEYQAVAAALDLGDPADIVFVGSSRARESVLLPALRRQIEAGVHHPVTVANYGVSGARAYEFNAIIHRILREPHLPRMILCGFSERDLGKREDEQFDQAAMFWNFSDWRRARAAGDDVYEFLPIVARNEIGRVWRTLQLRDALRLNIVSRLTGEPPLAGPSPVRGEITLFQQRQDPRSLADRPVSLARVERYIKSLHVAENFPHPQLVRALNSMIQACKAAKVSLVLYEVPTPKIFRDNLPPGAYHAYLSTVEACAQAGGAKFVQVNDLKARFSNRDFIEQSHMNPHGARIYTALLSRNVIVRQLERDAKLHKKKTKQQKSKAKRKKSAAAVQ